MSDTEELTIEVGEGKVRIGSSAGGKVSEDFKPDELDRRVVNIFEDWLRKGKITEDEEMEVLGNILYRAIFFGKVRDFFEQKLREMENKKKGNAALRDTRLPIALIFTDDVSEWARLPWEFLYYPAENTPLATKTSLVFLRRTPSNLDRENLVPPEGSLKVLIVKVQPEEFMEGIDAEDASKYEESFNAIVKEVESLKDLKIEVMGPLVDPTPENLSAALTKEPHVVHYIGYGKYEKEVGQIALMNPASKKPGWYTKAKFADCFNIAGTPPRLVFLQMCQGPQKETPGDYYLKANFADLAPEVMRKQIPVVVAMRYPVQPDVAHKFTQKFYETLARGRSVATAVQDARWHSNLGKKGRNLGSPVLFMHSNDGLILPLTEAQTERSTQTSSSSTSASSAAISPPPSQASSESAPPEFSFDDLAEVGFEQARAVSLKAAEVSREIEILRKTYGQDIEGIRKVIAEKIQALSLTDPTSNWVTVYSAMAKKLKPQQTEVTETK